MAIREFLKVTAILVCFAIFLKGFFPVKIVSPGYSSKKITPHQRSSLNTTEDHKYNYNSNIDADLVPRPSNFSKSHNNSSKGFQYQRLVFMVIDALRTDFMYGQFNYMPRTNHLLSDGHGLSFVAESHPPTVTLPRLKAITTGSIPSFVDVILNFGSTALMEDNIITQMKINKKKIVFFGDDTWIKLFPNHFERSDGTTSFFVMDYTEVDENVTRHLQKELHENDDWDVMVLHYLGLDHIGHFAGPNSPLVRPKLAEMDKIITRLYAAVEKWSNSGIPSLLVICGDHGMSDQGGHGGSTPSEISVPLVFMSPYMQKTDPSQRRTVSQTDLCPTLSVLLGLPVPMNNLGTVILETLGDYTLEQKISVLQQNIQQVMRVFKSQVSDISKESAYLLYENAQQKYLVWLKEKDVTGLHEWEERGQSILVAFSESLQLIAEKAGKLSVQYDVYAMAVSIVLLWLIMVSQVINMCEKDITQPEAEMPSNFFWLISLLGSALMTHITMCTVGVPSTLMCSSSPVSIATQVIVAGVFVFVMLHILSGWKMCLPLKQQIKLFNKKWTIVEQFLIFSSFVHTLTLLSSSFVEEEHQTFYFLTTSIHLLLLVKLGHAFLKSYTSGKTIGLKIMQEDCKSNTNFINQSYDGLNDFEDCCKDEIDKLDIHPNYPSKVTSETSPFINVGSSKESEDNKNVADNKEFTRSKKQFEEKEKYSLSASLVVILFFLRVLRRWNQTGDKWLNVPDIGDWLVEPQNKGYLSILGVLSLLILGTSRSSILKRSTTMCINLSLAFAYLYRCASGSMFFPFIKLLSHTGTIEARMSFLFIALAVISSILPYDFFHFHWKDNSNGSDSQEVENKPKNHIQSDPATSMREKHLDAYRHENSSQDALLAERRSKISLSPNDGSLSEAKRRKRDFPSGISIINGVMTGWLSLMCLLLRPHNMTVVALMSLVEQLASHVIVRCGINTKATLIYCLWMGQAFFFFQGNSNSISSVDVSAGYVGLENYDPLLTGLLLSVATYAGPLFWLLTFVKIMYLSSNRNGKKSTCSYGSTFQALTLKLVLPLAVYTVLVATQRHHLFVWTVFSPKLLYQGMETLVISIFSTIAFCFLHFISEL